MWRLKNIIANRGASGLTVLPREHLFFTPTPGLQQSVHAGRLAGSRPLDKTPFICFIALFGLGLFIWDVSRSRASFYWPGLGVPWFAAAAVIGYERTVEALLRMTIWFAFFGLTEVASC